MTGLSPVGLQPCRLLPATIEFILDEIGRLAQEIITLKK